jgi:AcrR family transcriptional regulator
VVSEHGIPGATIALVARSAGVGIGTVYRCFDDQKAMLRSAIETMSDEMVKSIPASYKENALEQMREMAAQHEALVSANGGYIARLWHQFVGASETLGLLDTMVQGRREAAQAIREVCERGKAQGSIRQDVDLDLLAYRILEQGWGAEMSLLLGHDDFLGQNCAMRVMEELLESVSTEAAADERGLS